MPRMLSLIYKPVWILFIQLTFCLADSQAPTIRLNDVNAGMLLVEDEYPGNYHEIPKLKTDVKIKIDGMVASATVDQVFTNDGNTPIEAIYVFPLPEEAAVYEMQVLIGDRLIESLVKEKKEAKKIYIEARNEGKQASLTEQERPNIFTNSVANIMPGDTIIVRLKYVDHVRYDNGVFSYRFPTVVGPRYIPGETITGYSGSGWSFDTDQVEDASRITPSVLPDGAETDNTISLSVELNAGLEIESAASISHTIDVKNTGTGHRMITLTKGVEIPNRDFVLEYKIKQGQQPKAALFTTQKGADSYFMLMALPNSGESSGDRLPKEMIYIIDISGSMKGASIGQAKNSLITAISELNERDHFNIIAFDQRYQTFADQPLKASMQNKTFAYSFIRNLEAQGGTEVLPALKAGMRQAKSSSAVSMIFLITDGSVGNEDLILNALRNNLGNARLFPIGIGSAPNSYLLSKAAEEGRGTYTYIYSPNEVKVKMMNLLKKIESPVLTGINLDFAEEVDMVPVFIPDLFKGEPLLIFGKSANMQDQTVKLTGKTPEGYITLELPLDTESEKENSAISTIWARKKIAGLMNEYRLGKKSVKQDVIDLAIDHHLVTKFTSFVAVENQIVNTRRDLTSLAIPVDLPQGWDYKAVFGNPKKYKMKLVGGSGDEILLAQKRMKLPQTATSYPLQFLLGLLLIALSEILTRFFFRRVK